MTASWQERMDAVRLKLAGRPKPKTTVGAMVRREEDLDAERYSPNRGFDYADDVKAYPFAWQPERPMPGLSMSYPPRCRCGRIMRELRAKPLALCRVCDDCAAPDGGSEIDLAELVKRCRPEVDPLRAVTRSLPGLGDALTATVRAEPAKRGRDYTVNEKREVLRLRRSGETPTAIARSLNLPLETVRSWIRRHSGDPFLDQDH